MWNTNRTDSPQAISAGVITYAAGNGDQIHAYDLASTQGTFSDGLPVRRALLADAGTRLTGRAPQRSDASDVVLHARHVGEVNDILERFTGLQLAFGNGDDIAHGATEGLHRVVPEDHGARDAVRRLQRAQMIRRVERVERAVTHLVEQAAVYWEAEKTGIAPDMCSICRIAFDKEASS